MLILASTDLLQVVTSSANAVGVLATWADNTASTFTPGVTPTNIAAATTTTVVAAPAASTTRNISHVSFRAVGGANTLTVRFNNGTAFELVSCTLASGERLEYENGHGWRVLDATGAVKQATAGGAVPTGTGFRHMTAGVEDAAAKLVDTADVNADQITNALLANMAANSVKVEATGAAVNPQDLAMGASTILARLAAGNIVAATVAQILTLLGAFATVNLQAFTTVGGNTYTPTSGMKFCIAITTGSGGGGGGADNNAATAFFIGVGAGGGAGGTCIEFFSAATIGASQTVTIGTAGTAGSATNGTAGGAGGNTTFGALHTANGGAGGAGSGLSATLGQVQAGGLGGTPTGGTLNVIGGDGRDGWGIAVDSTNDSKTLHGGDGGGSFWGGGARGPTSQSLTAGGATALTAAGVAGRAFGAGGSGALCSTSTAGAAGGAGALGCCLVIEFI